VPEHEAGVSVTVGLGIPVIASRWSWRRRRAQAITFAAFKALAQHRHK
jgi:hypothetical protein